MTAKKQKYEVCHINLETFKPNFPRWNYVLLDWFSSSEDSGKWLLFVPPEKFLPILKKVTELALSNKLTSCFKVLGEPTENGVHIFCIYCDDYHDIVDVRRVATKLNKEHILDYSEDKCIYFKPDAATHISSRANEKGLKLTLFKFDGKKNELYARQMDSTWALVTGNKYDVSYFGSYLLNLSIPEDWEGWND